MNELNSKISRAIEARRSEIAAAITDRQYQAYPELAARYGPIGRARCLEDANFHLCYLGEAISANSGALFADYIGWAKVMLAGRGIPAEDLARNLGFMREVLAETLPAEMSAPVSRFIDAGLAQLPSLPDGLPSYVQTDEPLAELLRHYLDALLAGERHRASQLILQAVAAGSSIKDIYLYVFQRAQYEIGRLWQINEVSVAQEHYCTAATQLIMSQLYPQIFTSVKNGKIMVAACVANDLHEIGVRMIADFFEMAGWDTFYLGANTPATSILQTVCVRRAHVLAISATITSHVSKVAELIELVRSNEGCRDTRILVGGYPFNVDAELWRRVGADASAQSAAEAITVAEALTGC